MTKDQRQKIQQMRREGQSYLQIASVLGISENTIKSFCRRNKISTFNSNKPQVMMETQTACKQCGKPLTHGTKGQPKKFCSEECRRTWWKANDGQLVKKAWYTQTCVGCGKEFQSYGNQTRKFCGHACYIRKRFEKAGDDYESRAV